MQRFLSQPSQCVAKSHAKQKLRLHCPHLPAGVRWESERLGGRWGARSLGCAGPCYDCACEYDCDYGCGCDYACDFDCGYDYDYGEYCAHRERMLLAAQPPPGAPVQ